MRQKSLNETMTSLGKASKTGMSTDILDIDDLLDDEGWDLLNSLTEEELEQLNSDFDPENSFLPIGERGSHMGAINSAPMFSKEDLVENLEKMVANSKPVIKNDKIRQKEEERQKVKEAKLKKQYSRERFDPPPEPKSAILTEEEEALLNEATEEELIEAADTHHPRLENALHTHQYELREKLLIALQLRHQHQQTLYSFIDDVNLTDKQPSTSYLNERQQLHDNYGHLNAVKNGTISSQADAQSPYEKQHDRPIVSHIYRNESEIESETDTLTESISRSHISTTDSESNIGTSIMSDSASDADTTVGLKKLTSDKTRKRVRDKRMSREYSGDRVRKYNEGKYQDFTETSSLSETSDTNDGFPHDGNFTHGLLLPKLTEVCKDASPTPDIKVDVNVTLNRQSDGSVHKVTYSNYSSACDGNIADVSEKQSNKRCFELENNTIKLFLDIELNVDENNNPIDETKKASPITDDTDAVNRMINDIARRRQKRQKSTSKEKQAIASCRSETNCEVARKKSVGNIQGENIPNEETVITKPLSNQSRRKCDRHQQNRTDVPSVDELFSDSGIDQTSSEMGFTTPMDFERSLITPTNERNCHVSTPFFNYNQNNDALDMSTDENIIRTTGLQENFVEKEHAGTVDKANEQVKLRNNNKTARKQRPLSGSYSRPRRNSSKVKISKEKSFEKIKKQAEKSKNEKSAENTIKKKERKKSRDEVADEKPACKMREKKDVCEPVNIQQRKALWESAPQQAKENGKQIQKTLVKQETNKLPSVDGTSVFSKRQVHNENMAEVRRNALQKQHTLELVGVKKFSDKFKLFEKNIQKEPGLKAEKPSYVNKSSVNQPLKTRNTSNNLNEPRDMKVKNVDTALEDKQNAISTDKLDHSDISEEVGLSSIESSSRKYSQEYQQNNGLIINGGKVDKNDQKLYNYVDLTKKSKQDIKGITSNDFMEGTPHNKQSVASTKKLNNTSISTGDENLVTKYRSVEKMVNNTEYPADEVSDVTNVTNKKERIEDGKKTREHAAIHSTQNKRTICNDIAADNNSESVGMMDKSVGIVDKSVGITDKSLAKNDKSLVKNDKSLDILQRLAKLRNHTDSHDLSNKKIEQSKTIHNPPKMTRDRSVENFKQIYKNGKDFVQDGGTESNKPLVHAKNERRQVNQERLIHRQEDNQSQNSPNCHSNIDGKTNERQRQIPNSSDVRHAVQTDDFPVRQTLKQRRLKNQDEYDFDLEEKVSVARQLDLLNLQRGKEISDRTGASAKMTKEVKPKQTVEEIPKTGAKQPAEKFKSHSVRNSPQLSRRQFDNLKPHSLRSSPQMERKSIVQESNKDSGLLALDMIRSKLRKVPKPEEKEEKDKKEESFDGESGPFNQKAVNQIDEKPKKKSALAALLQRDAESLESKKFKGKMLDEEKADFRGVTPVLLQQALLKMNGILTNDQINSVFAGEKPQGASIKTSTAVKATKIPPKKIVAPTDEETELDVVKLMKHLKEDSDSLFYLCVNNQPRLEKQVKQAIIRAVETSKKMKHLSLAMTGLIDADVKLLAKSIRYNEQLETLNLESNIITNSGLDALMKVVARHPTLREVKISNQKQPFGGQGEAIMANAIDGNENILKFGYSFKQPGPRNKADRAIIRHNEKLRQKRRNGEDVYDLKAVCKIRDPWPQPWIISKGRRLLGGLIEAKVTEMGHMIDPDNDVRRESRGPRLSEKEAKPLDINALLSARKEKLKGTKIAQLEAEQEKKNKRLMQEMMESTKPPPKEKEKEAENDGDEEALGKAADIVQLNGHDDPKTRNKKHEELDDGKLDHGSTEDSPPKSHEKKKKPLGKGLKIAALDDDQPKVIRRRKQQDEEDAGGLNFDEFEVKQEEKPKKEPITKGVKIASLDDDEPTVPRRRRKKYDEEEEEGGVNFDDFVTNEPTPEVKKEEVIEEKKEVEKKKEEKPIEDKKKKLSREGGTKIVANFTETNEVPRRRKKQRSFEEETSTVETVEQTAAEKLEEESRKQKLLKNAKDIKAELPDHGLVRRRKASKEQSVDEEIDPFSNVAKKVSKLPSPEEIRRRREIEQEEEIDPFKELEARKKKEAEERAAAEAKAKKMAEEEEKRKIEEHRQKLADVEGRKKKLSLEGGKKVVAAFEPVETVPRRRRKPKYEDEPEENEFLKSVAKSQEEEKVKDAEKEDDKSETQAEPTPQVEEKKNKEKKEEEEKKKLEEKKKEEEKKKWRAGGKKIVGLTPVEDTVPVRKRRSKKFDEDEDLGLPLPKESEVKQTESEIVEKASEETKVEKQNKDEGKKRLLGGKAVAALPPPEEKVSLRRRKKDEDESEKVDPIALVEKTELNAVRVAAKNIKGLPPPDTGITSIRRRRKKDEDEEMIDPFASVPEKVENKKEEIKPEEKKEEKIEKKKEPSATDRTERPAAETKKLEKQAETKPKAETQKVDKTLIAERAKKIVALPPPDEGITPLRRRRRRDDDEESDPFGKTEETSGRRSRTSRPREDDDDTPTTRRFRNKVDDESGGRWYTDEETKSGDRRFEKKEEEKKADDVIDIFADRDEDRPRLSLRERMARRGR